MKKIQFDGYEAEEIITMLKDKNFFETIGVVKALNNKQYLVFEGKASGNKYCIEAIKVIDNED